MGLRAVHPTAGLPPAHATPPSGCETGASAGQQPAALSPAGSASAPPAGRTGARWPFLLMKAVFSAVLIYWILRSTPLHEVGGALRRADVRFILAALASNVVGYVISALRWRTLLRAQQGDASLVRLVGAFMAAIFFNNLLPSTIGGDALRLYDSWRILGSKTRAMAVIVVDRLLGLLAVLFYAFVALLVLGRSIGPDAPKLYATVLVVAGGLLGALMAAIAPPRPLRRLQDRLRAVLPARLGDLQDRTLAAFAAFRDRQRSLALAMGLSILLQANVVVNFYFFALALHQPVPFHAFFLIVPLASLIMMAPVSINGIGLREHALIALLGLYGITRPEAVAFAWLAYGLLVVQGLAGGIVYSLRRRGRSAQIPT
ncbi:MAG: lysylphosphatidylglycerol synthase transmembrane domain-containing protein [Phycisphaerae bacterium]